MTPQSSFPPELRLHDERPICFFVDTREQVHSRVRAAYSYSRLVRTQGWLSQYNPLHDSAGFLEAGSSKREISEYRYSPPGDPPRCKFTNYLKTKNRPFFNPFSWTVSATWRSPERN